MVGNYQSISLGLDQWAMDLEKRLKEALEGKVMTADSVNQFMDTNIGTHSDKIEDYVKQITAKVSKYVEDHDKR
eukprot:5149798-Lingulodinium_polyedra.AAC.1